MRRTIGSSETPAPSGISSSWCSWARTAGHKAASRTEAKAINLAIASGCQYRGAKEDRSERRIQGSMQARTVSSAGDR